MLIQITGSDDDFQFRVVTEDEQDVIAVSRHYDSMDDVRSAITEFQEMVGDAEVADLT